MIITYPRVIKALILLMAIMLLMFSLWFILSPPEETTINLALNVPDSFMTSMNATKLDKNGAPHYILLSPQVKHYVEGDTALVEQPFFTFFPTDAPPWQLKADMAKVVHGMEKIFLTGNVFTQQLPGIHSHNVKLTTTSAALYPNQSFAETDQPVTVIQPNSIIHAIGMQIDMKQNLVKFLSHTQGQYGEIPET